MCWYLAELLGGDVLSRLRSRADRIREKVDLTELLERLGYAVHGGDSSEQQFKCDLHGGEDRKPSARVYPLTKSWFCFGCGKPRDAVSTVMDKNGLDARAACQLLEDWYDLPPLPWADDEGAAPVVTKDLVLEVFKATGTWEQAQKRCRVALQSVSNEHTFDMTVTFKLWAMFDKISWGTEHGTIAEDKALGLFSKLRAKVIEAEVAVITNA